MELDALVIADRTFTSRLIVGTGKYPSHQVMSDAHAASATEMVTVAVRRVHVTGGSTESLLDYIDTNRIFLLPNTAGCYSAEDAIRTARLGREVGLSNWIKLEVIGDERTLFPDNVALLEATSVLVREGFVVLPYRNNTTTRRIEIDPERGLLVAKLFEWYAGGDVSLEELTRRAFAIGLTHNRSRSGPRRMTKSEVHRLLRNPIYVGEFKWNGELYRGSHEPLVLGRSSTLFRTSLNRPTDQSTQSIGTPSPAVSRARCVAAR